MATVDEDMKTIQENLATRIGLANANFVTDRPAIGGDLDMRSGPLCVEQLADLVAAGITHVLDVRLERNDTGLWAEVDNVTYRWAGIDDAGPTVPVAWFEGVAGWALDALQDPQTRLLTHCHMGINRGPSAGYAVLLAQGWDPVQAIDAIRGARPCAHVAYAEDALRWRHWRRGSPDEARQDDLRRLREWRVRNPLDLHRVIWGVRRDEAS